MKRLGDAELEIMETIWAEKEPVTAACILKNLKTRNTWALSSLMTALARLTEKGFVCCDRKYRHKLSSGKRITKHIRGGHYWTGCMEARLLRWWRI